MFPRLSRVDNWVMLGMPTISELRKINAVAWNEGFMLAKEGEPEATLLNYSLYMIFLII